MSRDALRLEVFQHLFAAVAEEMGAALCRSAFSVNIKERRDFSCALFDGRGRMISQAAHIPIHLGSVPLCVAAVLEECELGSGDAIVLNDPFRGGTHLPDVTLVSPVFVRGGARPDFLVANRAHHADVGGAVPGSMAPAADVHGEGLRIPPVALVRAGAVRTDVLALLLANMRVARERRGDLMAQWAANRLGAERMGQLAAEHGARELALRARDLSAWTRARVAREIARFPARAVRFEDVLELPSPAGAVARLRVAVRRRGKRLEVDLRACDDQVEGGLSTTRAVALSAVFYVLRLLLPPGTPTNDGVLADVDVLTRPGSLVDARYPSAVAAGNVETSQRLVDVLLGAFARAWPGRMPAASSGSMSNLTLGDRGAARAFGYYETIAGGAGASAAGPGAHAVHTHMTNTRNTPIEALENELPVRVRRYAVRRGSGGAGARRGGDGIVRELELCARARATFVATRRDVGPWGLEGGGPGATGTARVCRAGARAWAPLAPGGVVDLEPGDRLELATPGGGGHGRAPR
jgi:N-methylhydantoinase B